MNEMIGVLLYTAAHAPGNLAWRDRYRPTFSQWAVARQTDQWAMISHGHEKVSLRD
jgi:hypothetical protein